MSGWLADIWSWLVALPLLERILLGVCALLLALLLLAVWRALRAAFTTPAALGVRPRASSLAR